MSEKTLIVINTEPPLDQYTFRSCLWGVFLDTYTHLGRGQFELSFSNKLTTNGVIVQLQRIAGMVFENGSKMDVQSAHPFVLNGFNNPASNPFQESLGDIVRKQMGIESHPAAE